MENQEEKDEIEIEELKETFSDIKNRLQPYQRPIVYIGITIFILLIFFLGFAAGTFKICTQTEGFLDDSFYCHINYYKEREAQRNKIFEIKSIKLDLPEK